MEKFEGRTPEGITLEILTPEELSSSKLARESSSTRMKVGEIYQIGDGCVVNTTSRPGREAIKPYEAYCLTSKNGLTIPGSRSTMLGVSFIENEDGTFNRQMVSKPLFDSPADILRAKGKFIKVVSMETLEQSNFEDKTKIVKKDFPVLEFVARF